MSLYLGIDPGASGAAVVIDGSGEVVYRELFAKKPLAAIAAELRANRYDLAVIEHVAAMPGQGVSSMFSFGESFGKVQGILMALEVPYVLLRPQAWQRAVGLSLPAKREGQDRSSRTREIKQAIVDAACRRWPKQAGLWDKKKNYPLADALFIAEAARLTLTATRP